MPRRSRSEEELAEPRNLELAWEVLEVPRLGYSKAENKAALAEVYLDLGEVSVENQDYGRAKSITGPDKRPTFPGKALVCGCSEVNLLSCLNRFVRLLDC